MAAKVGQLIATLSITFASVAVNAQSASPLGLGDSTGTTAAPSRNSDGSGSSTSQGSGGSTQTGIESRTSRTIRDNYTALDPSYPISGFRFSPMLRAGVGLRARDGAADANNTSVYSTLGLGFTASQNTARLSLHADYFGQTSKYFGNDSWGDGNWRNSLNSRAKVTLVDDFAFIEANANITLIPQDAMVIVPANPYDSGVIYNNLGYKLREHQLFRVSPYITGPVFGSFARYELRYTKSYTNRVYLLGPSAKDEDKISGLLVSGRDFHNFKWSTSGSIAERKFRDGRDQTRVNAETLLTYAWPQLPELRVGAAAVFDRIEFLSVNQKDYGFGHGVTLDWRPTPRFNLSAGWYERYFGNTGYLVAGYTKNRTSINFNYNKSIQTSSNDGLLFFSTQDNTFGSSSVNSASMLYAGGGMQNQAYMLGPFGITQILFGAYNDIYIDTESINLSLSHQNRKTLYGISLFAVDRNFATSRPATMILPNSSVFTYTSQQITHLKQFGFSARTTYQLNSIESASAYLLQSTGNYELSGTSIENGIVTIGANYQYRVNSATTLGATIRRSRVTSGTANYNDTAILGTMDTRF